MIKTNITIDIAAEFLSEDIENDYVEMLDRLLVTLKDVTRGVKATHEIKGVDNV